MSSTIAMRRPWSPAGGLSPRQREAAKLSDKLAVKLAFAGAIEGFDDYEAALAAEARRRTSRTPKPGSTMLYTSGTTGPAQGRLPANDAGRFAAHGQGQRDGEMESAGAMSRWSPGPLYHAAPLGINMVIPINAGVTVLLQDKWDAEDTLRLIEKYRATHTHVVPTMMHRMLQLPEETRKKYDVSLDALDHARRGALPGPREEGDDGLVRAGHSRVLLLDRGRRGLCRPTRLAEEARHGGQGGARGRDQAARQRWQSGAAGPGRPHLCEGAGHRPVRILQGAGQDGVELSRRLVHARRHGPVGRRWRSVPDRPHGRTDHLRRGQHLPGRDRRGADPARGRRRCRGGRRAQRGLGRGDQGCGRAQARLDAFAGDGAGRSSTSRRTACRASSGRARSISWTPCPATPPARCCAPRFARLTGRVGRRASDSTIPRKRKGGVSAALEHLEYSPEGISTCS